jgi:hypothetical protein
MKRNLTFSLAGPLALVLSGCGALAYPRTLGGPQQLVSSPARAAVDPVRFGGGHGFAGGHGFGGGRSFGGGYGFRGDHGFHHGHHLRAGFNGIGVPYYSYDDEGCWWSRRYHRWVC